MPHEVIMPALGMAQDTGLLIAWLKGPGDAVTAGDVLFEVETDKSTMEVEAGQDGYLAELRAEAGENVPVGEVIAVITAEKPGWPVQRSMAGQAEPASAEDNAPGDDSPAAVPFEAPAEKPAPRPQPPTAAQTHPPQANGRILASPKAKRLAAEQGLDLSRLAANGIEQPYHVADLETLSSLPSAAPAVAATSMQLSASVPAEGFEAFHAWLAAESEMPVATTAILAAFLTGALRTSQDEPAEPLAVAVERPVIGRTLYSDADFAGLADLEPSEDGEPALLLRDLTATRLDGLRLGADATLPVLTLTRKGQDIAISLEADGEALSPDTAIGLVSEFAARLETPLRQLL